MPALHFKSPHSRQLALWVLRAFSPALGRGRFFDGHDYNDYDIAAFLRLPSYPKPEEVESITASLDLMRQRLESTRLEIGPSRQARENFTHLTKRLGFNATEALLLRYLACQSAEPVLEDTHRVLRLLIAADPARFFAGVLDLRRTAVANALRPGGRLRNCGLLERDGVSIRFASQDVALQLLHDRFEPAKILRQFGTSPPPSYLTAKDFPHLRPTLDLLVPYLRKVLRQRKAGVNILLHGPPGTGKTELARVIGAATGSCVFEVTTEDADGDPLQASRRLNALSAAQNLFRNTRMLLVFDEAEDVFTPAWQNARSIAATRKGWFNKLLEENRFPVVWISNSIDELDAAFARRFDFIVEVPIPPRQQRWRILAGVTGGSVSADLLDRLADSEHLAPAVIARAQQVVENIGSGLSADERDQAFGRLLSNTLKAQGHPDPVRGSRSPIQTGVYDLAHLNTPANLQQIAEGLRNSGSARLCLYGPPGTGKTAFGHWLARELSQPLQVRKASDLLSPYHGVTEKKIARTFEEAASEGAVLLLDEVDSFLRDRSHAHHSWEVTQINEMLTQMEAYSGILIASTNLVDHLDPASLRRFDVKIRFDYLRPEQVATLLRSYCESFGLPAPADADLARTSAITRTTPGDFAAVARRHQFQPFRCAGSLLDAVVQENAHHRPAIGFVG